MGLYTLKYKDQQMKRYTAAILAMMILITAHSMHAQHSTTYMLSNCIDSSSISGNSMRMEINTAKQCAETFAADFDRYLSAEHLRPVIAMVEQGNVPQAIRATLADTSLSKFEMYRLLARLSVLGIDMVSAEDYYDKTLQHDSGNTFAHILEFSEFCRICNLKNKAKDLGTRALSLADSPYGEYLGRINMASILLDMGDGERALRELGAIESIKLKKKPHDMPALMDMMRGDIFVEKDEPQVALLYYRDALAKYRKLKNHYREPMHLLCEISAIETRNGNSATAGSCLSDALEYARRYPNNIDRNIAQSSIYLQWGMLEKSLGNPDKAREKLQTSLQTISLIVMKNRNYIADLAEIEASQAAIEIDMGDYTRAEALCEEAYKIYSQERFEYSAEAISGKALVLKTYGDLYRAWAQPAEAIKKYNEALYTYQILSRYNSLDTYEAHRAMVLNSLGATYEYSLHNANNAISNYKMAARILHKVVEAHPRHTISYAQVLSNIGNIYRKFGTTDSSLKYMEKALTIFRSKPNLNDIEKAEYSKICNNLGLQYKAMGNYDIAEPFFESAYQIRKYLIGKSDAYLPLWADILNNYGLYYVDIQDYDLGIYYLEKALDIRLDLSKDIETSRMLAESYDNLGDVYCMIDSLELSEQHYQKSLAERNNLIKHYSPRVEYPGYVNTMQKLASVYRKDNALLPALILMNKLVTNLYEQDTWEGEELDWKTMAQADANHNKALILSDLGMKEEARDAMLEAARGYIYGAEEIDFKYYPVAADAYCQVGNLSCDIDDYKSAEIWYKKALSISKELYTSGEMPAYSMVNALNNLGRMYYSMQNMEEAKKCYMEGKEILDNDRSFEADMENIITGAIINLNIVEYYIYEKNSGVDDDEYANCVKLLEETISTLKPFTENSGVSHYYEQAQILLKNILN